MRTVQSGQTVHEADEILLGFTRALRAAGVQVTLDRAQSFATAVALVDFGDPRATYLAGRATLCSAPDDLERYDQVFHAWFNHRDGLPRTVQRNESPQLKAISQLPGDDTNPSSGSPENDDEDAVRAMASRVERLQNRDVASLSAAERALLAGLFQGLNPRLPTRRSARRSPWRRGSVDLQRTLLLTFLARRGSTTTAAPEGGRT